MSICKRCGKDVDGIHTCTPPEVYKTTGQRIVEQWLGVDEIKNWDNRPEMSKLASLFDQALETANAEVERMRNCLLDIKAIIRTPTTTSMIGDVMDINHLVAHGLGETVDEIMRETHEAPDKKE
jgi:hypothetical protein